MTEKKQSAMEKTKAGIRNNRMQKSNTAKSAVQGFTALLEQPKFQNQIIKACAKHITPERMMRIARSAITRQPELWQCHPISFIGAIIDCAQLGLEPLPALGHVYLIPYRNKKAGIMEVQVQLGYKGMIAMALRSQKFHFIYGDVICENDNVIEYEEGLDAKFVYKTSFPDPRGDVIGAYVKAVLRDKDAPPLWKLIDIEDIEAARERSMEYKRWHERGSNMTGKLPIWVEHYKAMCIKTAIRRLSPFLAMAPELQSFFTVDEHKDLGLDTGYRDVTGIMTGPDETVPIEDEIVVEEVENAANNL